MTGGVRGPEPAGPAHRGRATVGALCTLLALLVGAGTVLAVTAPPGERAGADASGAAYAPADGDAATVAVAGTSLVVVEEHQRVGGPEHLAAAPEDVARGILGQVEDPAGLEVWRWSTTAVGASGRRSVVVSVQEVGDRGIRRLATYGGGYSAVFDPPLRLLPDRVVRGARWRDAGDALPGGLLTYRQRAQVTAVGGDRCATVERSLDLRLSGGVPFQTQVDEERWCPGRGLVAGSGRTERDGSVSETTYEAVGPRAARAAVGRVPVPGPGSAPGGTDPKAWRAVPLPTLARDRAVFGEMAVGGTRSLPPLATDDGLLVLPVDSGADLAAFRVEPAVLDGEPALVERWRVHPGGDLLRAVLLDDLVVVTTADRRVVAYDLGGLRRWSLATDDLVLADPVRTADGAVVVHSLDGAVLAVEAADGAVRWRARTRAEADATPAVLDDTVVVFDRSGQMLALDPADGHRRWSRVTTVVTASGAAGGRVVTVDGAGTATGYDAAGRRRWATAVPVTSGSVDAADGGAVVVGSGRAVTLDARTGAVRAVRPAPVAAAADATHVVTEGARVCAFAATGPREACWTLDPPGIGESRAIAVTTGEIWVVDSTLAVVRIGPPVVVP